MKQRRMWMEPDDNYHHGWPMGIIVRDIRSGRVVRVTELLRETILVRAWSECDCDACSGIFHYFSYRVQLLDGTNLRDGHYRAPEDLEKVSPLVMLAECATTELLVGDQPP